MSRVRNVPLKRSLPEAEWDRRARAWAARHGMAASLWLGPMLDPLPEPSTETDFVNTTGPERPDRNLPEGS